MKSRNVILSTAALSLAAVLLSGCGHEHTWMEATCTEPKTCSECKETEGEALGHTWEMATCMKPTTCTVCGFSPDENLADHACDNWTEVKDPTCTEAGFQKGICKFCAKEFTVELPMIEHSFSDWATVLEPTCSQEGSQQRTCSMCQTVEAQAIAKLEHDLNDWKPEVIPEYGKDGTQIQTCKLCNETVNTKAYTFAELITDKYILKGDTTGFTITDAAVYYNKDEWFTNIYTLYEVTNTGSDNLKLNSCKVDLLDKDSHLIGTIDEISVESCPKIIAPGEKGYFIGEVVYSSENSFDLSNGLDISAKITIDKTTDAPFRFEISDDTWKGTEPEAIGRMSNNTDMDYSWISIFALYRNDMNRVISVGRGYNTGTLAAGDNESFSAPWSWYALKNVTKNIKTCEVIAFPESY